jgi:hypothetical protein
MSGGLAQYQRPNRGRKSFVGRADPCARGGRRSVGFAYPASACLSRVVLLRGYEELQLTLVGAASLADQVPWNPMFVYEVPAAIEPS